MTQSFLVLGHIEFMRFMRMEKMCFTAGHYFGAVFAEFIFGRYGDE